MSLSRLPNNRWRAQVYDSKTKKSVSAAKVLGLKEPSFATKAEAKAARETARAALKQRSGDSKTMTVQAWWELWTTHRRFQRPKPASNINNRERTQAFAKRYGTVLLANVDHRIVSDWLLSGDNDSTIKFLKVMFSDAMSVEGGRLIESNPFAKVGVASRGNADKQPPSVEQAWMLINAAHEICPEGFAAWLQVACFTGMRSCELDALEWRNVDLESGWIVVEREFCSKSMSFQRPKNGKARQVPIHQPAMDALLALPQASEFVFVNSQGHHWSRSSRAYQWGRVRRETGWNESLYLSTRHHAGSFMVNELRLRFEDVAAALGHEDRGELCRRLYGHFENAPALERVKAAYAAYSGDELARRRAA